MREPKENLLRILEEWIIENGRVPSKREFCADPETPSDMPYRQAFGSWGNAIKALGYEPLKATPSKLAIENSVKARKGKISPNSKGGRIRNENGYIKLWMPDHPNSNKSGYIFEHRYLMSEHLGRTLLKHEDIHHINGIKDDNRIENLEVLTKAEHTRKHRDNKKDYFLREEKPCRFPACEEKTLSKYGLCNRHYKLQWQRKKKNLIENLHDFSEIDQKHTAETKEKLSELAKNQPRENGRFSSGKNKPDNPEVPE